MVLIFCAIQKQLRLVVQGSDKDVDLTVVVEIGKRGAAMSAWICEARTRDLN